MLLSDPLFWLAAGACLATLAIRVTGVFTFGKGGEFNRKHANRLMRYRLIAQGLAIVFIILFAWVRFGGSN